MTNNHLLTYYLTPHMANYFYKKLAHENKECVLLKICELLKYLTLSHHAEGEIPISHEIDEIWHFWILQTNEYSELMALLPSGQFIHHSSNDYLSNLGKINENEKINRQISFLASYVHNFGALTQEALPYWPMAIHLLVFLQTDLEGLNSFLENFSTLRADHDII